MQPEKSLEINIIPTVPVNAGDMPALAVSFQTIFVHFTFIVSYTHLDVLPVRAPAALSYL